MNFDITIMLVAAFTLLYMFLGYQLVRHLSHRKDLDSSVMMAGFDTILYEEGIEYRKENAVRH